MYVKRRISSGFKNTVFYYSHLLNLIVLNLALIIKMEILQNNNPLKRLNNRYRLVVMNDDTYEEVVTFKLSRLSVYVGLSTIFVLMVSVTIALIVFTPLKYYIPGYGSRQSRAEIQLLKIRTDSLEQAIHFKEQYFNSLKKVLNGSTPSALDTAALQIPKQEVTND